MGCPPEAFQSQGHAEKLTEFATPDLKIRDNSNTPGVRLKEGKRIHQTSQAD